MLLLAHLLTKNNDWRSRPIRLLRVIQDEAGRTEVLQHLTRLADDARIPATAKVIVAEDARDALQQASRRAAIVIMGFEAPLEGDEESFFANVEHMAGDLPRVVLVDSIGGMSLES